MPSPQGHPLAQSGSRAAGMASTLPYNLLAATAQSSRAVHFVVEARNGHALRYQAPTFKEFTAEEHEFHNQP